MTDIVERLQFLHVWPQFVADEHADVILPRQSKGLYDVGNVATEAADTIATLRKQLENAREALGVIAGLNDLEDAPDDAIEAYARTALYQCELVAREALKGPPC